MESIARAGLVALALAVGACDVRMDAELLDVESVGPDVVAPGARLRVEGGGFPTGRIGTSVFEGTAYRPGEPPSQVRVQARGRALSDEAFEVRVDDGLVAAMGGRATFEGTLRVAFAAVDGDGLVAGSRDGVTLDFVPADEDRVDREAERRERATALFRTLGIATATPPGDEDGVLVDGVSADGAAAAAGLSKGDRIVALDGVRLASFADAVPPPRARSTVLTVAREGEAGPIRVRVPFDGGPLGPTPVAWLAGAAAVFVLGLILLFLAPTARLTAALARAVHSSAGHPDQVRMSTAKVRWSVRGVLFGAIGGVAGVMALGVLPFTARVFTGGVDVGVLLFVSFAARLILAPGAARRGRPAWLGHLGRFVADGVPAVASVVAVVVFAGTLRLAGIVAEQGGAPWEWYAFRNPVAFVVFPVFVVAVMAREPGIEARGVAAQVAARMQRFVMAGLGTALFLGGWNVPYVDTDPLAAGPALRLAGAALFVAKAGLLSAIAARIPAPADRARWTVPLSLGCALVASTTLLAPWPAQVEQLGGPVLASLVTVVAAYVVARRRAAPAPIRVLPHL